MTERWSLYAYTRVTSAANYDRRPVLKALGVCVSHAGWTTANGIFIIIQNNNTIIIVIIFNTIATLCILDRFRNEIRYYSIVRIVLRSSLYLKKTRFNCHRGWHVYNAPLLPTTGPVDTLERTHVKNES